MAGDLKFPLRTLPFCAGLAWACGQAFGQDATSLADPTRPPSVAAEAAPADAEAAPAPAGLQTIVLRGGRKSVAVINGVPVELGGKVGDATLVKLSESEAVLQGPAGRQVLRLTPGIEKTDSAKPRAGGDNPGDRRAAEQRRAQPNPTQ